MFDGIALVPLTHVSSKFVYLQSFTNRAVIRVIAMKSPSIFKLAVCVALLVLTGACQGVKSYGVRGRVNVTQKCPAPAPTNGLVTITLENEAASLSVRTNLQVNTPFEVTVEWPEHYGEPAFWKIERVSGVCPIQCTLTNIPGPNVCYQHGPVFTERRRLTNEIVYSVTCSCDP
jgi:hypothetical protein